VRGLAAGQGASGLSLASGGGKQPMVLARDAIAAALAQGNVAGQVRMLLSSQPLLDQDFMCAQGSYRCQTSIVEAGSFVGYLSDPRVQGAAELNLIKERASNPVSIVSRLLGRAHLPI
jgi:hypothetical protein